MQVVVAEGELCLLWGFKDILSWPFESGLNSQIFHSLQEKKKPVHFSRQHLPDHNQRPATRTRRDPTTCWVRVTLTGPAFGLRSGCIGHTLSPPQNVIAYLKYSTGGKKKIYTGRRMYLESATRASAHARTRNVFWEMGFAAGLVPVTGRRRRNYISRNASRCKGGGLRHVSPRTTNKKAPRLIWAGGGPPPLYVIVWRVV
ncbi:uncharacterized protein [Heterodontus francisci]|uniref:uncharacterized protein n=1 Tax=Heterodontus francisci TaxID=7792 RepID=UPI00355C7AE8